MLENLAQLWLKCNSIKASVQLTILQGTFPSGTFTLGNEAIPDHLWWTGSNLLIGKCYQNISSKYWIALLNNSISPWNQCKYQHKNWHLCWFTVSHFYECSHFFLNHLGLEGTVMKTLQTQNAGANASVRSRNGCFAAKYSFIFHVLMCCNELPRQQLH